MAGIGRWGKPQGGSECRGRRTACRMQLGWNPSADTCRPTSSPWARAQSPRRNRRCCCPIGRRPGGSLTAAWAAGAGGEGEGCNASVCGLMDVELDDRSSPSCTGARLCPARGRDRDARTRVPTQRWARRPSPSVVLRIVELPEPSVDMATSTMSCTYIVRTTQQAAWRKKGEGWERGQARACPDSSSLATRSVERRQIMCQFFVTPREAAPQSRSSGAPSWAIALRGLGPPYPPARGRRGMRAPPARY
jgi:hypothetical protein